MAADLLERSVAFPVDENGVEVDADEPFPADDLPNLQIVQIPLVGADLKAVGMGGKKGAFGDLAEIPEA